MNRLPIEHEAGRPMNQSGHVTIKYLCPCRESNSGLSPFSRRLNSMQRSLWTYPATKKSFQNTATCRPFSCGAVTGSGMCHENFNPPRNAGAMGWAVGIKLFLL